MGVTLGMAFYGTLLRFMEALIAASPTILVGIFIAAVLRWMVGREKTRKIFGGRGLGPLLKAWALGMLLPVCSLGAIPVMRELRRAGVSGGALLAFTLTAPMFNPLSFLYGLTLSGPIVMFTFSFCSLLIVTLSGMAWDHFIHDEPLPEPPPERALTGVRRLAAMLVTTLRELAGATGLYILAGFAGVCLLALAIPHGSMMHLAQHEDWWAPLRMAAVTTLAYETPITAIVKVASMFQHGNSVGAAFMMLVFGAGINLGTILWVARTYGVRRCAAWFGVLWVIALTLAYAINRPLYPSDVMPADHTHAFDGYCQPFALAQYANFTYVKFELAYNTAVFERTNLEILCAVLIAGLALRFIEPKGKMEAWLQSGPAGPPRFDIVLSRPVLGICFILGIVAFSIFGCYVYYPPSNQAMDEIDTADTAAFAAIASSNWPAAEHSVDDLDGWTRKMEIGGIIRAQKLSPGLTVALSRLRDKIDLLDHSVDAKEQPKAKARCIDVFNAWRKLNSAFKNGTPLQPGAAERHDLDL